MPAVVFPHKADEMVRSLTRRVEWLERRTRGGGAQQKDGHPVLVAAADSPAFEKERAHVIVTGTDDHVGINSALALAGSAKETYGTVQLAQGTFHVAVNEIQVGNAALLGRGIGQTELVVGEAAAAGDYGVQLDSDYARLEGVHFTREAGVSQACRAVNVADGGSRPRYIAQIKTEGLWAQSIASPQSGGGGTSSYHVTDSDLEGDLAFKESREYVVDGCRIDGDIVLSTQVGNGRMFVTNCVFADGHGIGTSSWVPTVFLNYLHLVGNTLGFVRAPFRDGFAHIEGNRFNDPTLVDVACRIGAYSTVVGNIVDDVGYDQGIRIEADANDLTHHYASIIANNIIRGTTNVGIHLFNAGLGGSPGLNGMYVMGNTLEECTGNYEIAVQVGSFPAASSIDDVAIAHNIARRGSVVCGIYFEDDAGVGVNNLCWGNDMLSTYSTGALCLNGKARTIPQGTIVPAENVDTSAVGPMIPGAGIVRTKPEAATLDAARAHALMLGGM